LGKKFIKEKKERTRILKQVGFRKTEPLMASLVGGLLNLGQGFQKLKKIKKSLLFFHSPSDVFSFPNQGTKIMIPVFSPRVS
jgi:hypothetical protein